MIETASLITYSLGSCIGVTLYDPAVKVGGLSISCCPNQRSMSSKAQKNPWMFADTGVPLFFKEAYKLGAEKRRLQVKVAGGSQILDDQGLFNIGKRNYMALRKLFWTNNVLVSGEEVGGEVNRTVSIELSSGKVWVKTSGEGVKEL